MNDELEDVLDKLEPRRSVAAVAPIAFLVGLITGSILSGFVVFFALAMGPRISFGPTTAIAEDDAGTVIRDLASAVRQLNQRLEGQVKPAPGKPRSEPSTAGATEGEAVEAVEAVEAEELADLHEPVGPPAPTDAGDAVALMADIASLRRQLSEAKAALRRERADKQKLQREIDALQRDLQVTERLLEAASADAVYNRWLAFLQAAEATICADAARSRRVECGNEVTDALLTPTRREQFEYCLRSGQAEPSLHRIRPQDSPPDHGFVVGESRLTKDWMVLFCDPRLPIDQDRRLSDPSATAQRRASP